MAELFLIRHAQASFGAADYDVLSDLGHQQSEALGRALAAQGVKPDVFVIGAQRRHRETFEGIIKGMGMDPFEAEIHAGLNEFAFKELLEARTQLSNLMTYMDGKTGAEDLISKIITDPTLLKTLAAQPAPKAESDEE